MRGVLNSIDPARGIGLIRDDANDVRDFKLTDMVREIEFAYLAVGDRIGFPSRTPAALTEAPTPSGAASC
jgi:hypothetical protein